MQDQQTTTNDFLKNVMNLKRTERWWPPDKKGYVIIFQTTWQHDEYLLQPIGKHEKRRNPTLKRIEKTRPKNNQEDEEEEEEGQFKSQQQFIHMFSQDLNNSNNKYGIDHWS
jgi:hypothetical protein